MWRWSISMGMDKEKTRDHATNWSKMDTGRMATPATLHTLATAAPTCCIVGGGAVCGVQIAAWAEHDFPGLYRLLTAIQVQVLSETEPDNTGGQLPEYPRNRPRLKPCWSTEEVSERYYFQVDASRALRTSKTTQEQHSKWHRSKKKKKKKTQRRGPNS